jgi:hypothetical protein
VSRIGVSHRTAFICRIAFPAHICMILPRCRLECGLGKTEQLAPQRGVEAASSLKWDYKNNQQGELVTNL